MKKIFLSISLILILSISSFAKDKSSLTVDELEVYIEKNIIVIDIRDENSWKKTGILPNSFRLTYTKVSEKKWFSTLIKLIKDKNKAFVLISKDGIEAKNLAKKLHDEKKLRGPMYLDGGITEWIDSDRKIINY